MGTDIVSFNRFENREMTEIAFEDLLWGDVFHSDAFCIEDIQSAITLDNSSAFLEGLVARLNEMGISCTVSDKAIILAEVKRLYKENLHIICPKPVENWINGITPSVEKSRKNHYSLCMALGMDIRKTAEFFIKHFLSFPFNYKDRTDAVFFYGLHNHKSYAEIEALLTVASEFSVNANSHTQTAQVGKNILEIDNDEEFLHYLSRHCYSKEQQYQIARTEIIALADEIKAGFEDANTTNRRYENNLNGLLLQTIFEASYQRMQKSKEKYTINTELPRQFIESMPNDVTFGQIMRGEKASFETLRKTLIILKFYSFYESLDNMSEQEIQYNIEDFHEELDDLLVKCGLGQLYVRHPFDHLIMLCAKHPTPVEFFAAMSRSRYIKEEP